MQGFGEQPGQDQERAQRDRQEPQDRNDQQVAASAIRRPVEMEGHQRQGPQHGGQGHGYEQGGLVEGLPEKPGRLGTLVRIRRGIQRASRGVMKRREATAAKESWKDTSKSEPGRDHQDDHGRQGQDVVQVPLRPIRRAAIRASTMRAARRTEIPAPAISVKARTERPPGPSPGDGPERPGGSSPTGTAPPGTGKRRTRR